MYCFSSQLFICHIFSYGFHINHCKEALDYCAGNIEDCLYLLYCKYFNQQYPFVNYNSNCTEAEILEQRADEKSSLESIYEKSFQEKVKDSVWILELRLDYLINIFRQKKQESQKNIQQLTIKKKEKCKLFLRGHCKYADKCRFSHEVEKVKEIENEIIFELEIRFPKNSKYPFEPPLIFLKKNDILPQLVKLQISKRLFEEADFYAKNGIPSIYTIIELLQNSEEIIKYIKKDLSFLSPKMKLFDELKVTKSLKHKNSHYRKGMTNRDNKRNISEEEIFCENTNLVERFKAKMDTEDYRKMLISRQKLPVWNCMKDILNTIEKSQVRKYEFCEM